MHYLSLLVPITIILVSFSVCQAQQNSKCNYINCPYLQGICSNDKCICARHYTTITDKSNKNNQIYCNYHSKSKITAFLLEFFFPLGLGHFYTDNYGKGLIKLILFTLLLLVCCCELCCIRSLITKGLICLSFLTIIIAISWAVFQLLDIFGYLVGFYTDGYNVELY